jgi:hydrogenase maturation protease
VKAKTLLLGLGNPILSDDGVGIEVAERIRERLNQRSDVDILEASVGGLALLDHITGYEKLVLVDSIKTDAGSPGTLHRLKLEDLDSTIHSSSPHDTNFATAIEFGRRCGVDVPQTIVIYAIEVEDNSSFSEQLTASVERMVPSIVETIVTEQFTS